MIYDDRKFHKMDKESREKIERLLISKPTLVQYDCDVSDFANELITLIRNATLDEVNDRFSDWLAGDEPLDADDFNNAIYNMRDSDDI